MSRLKKYNIVMLDTSQVQIVLPKTEPNAGQDCLNWTKQEKVSRGKFFIIAGIF